MRLLRVELRNYRGVVERDIAFSPTGVTVVEGPNEIGKSSIAEAVDRVLEDLDSTTRKRVVELKPVGRDVGPEVAIEVETGQYAFRYRKRFLRERQTELHITRPRPSQLSGREAHERVRAMLAETVDLALWKALRIQQGSVIDQASLVDQSSLSAALDRAAGEAPAGQEERSLFDAAHAEYLQYWTETGRRKQDAAERDRAAESARADVERIQSALKSIDADVDASVRLQAEAGRLAERRGKQFTRVDELVAQQQRVSKLEAAVGAVESRRDAAVVATGQARRDYAARLDAIKEVETAAADAQRLGAEAEDVTPALGAAETRTATAVHALAAARAACNEAQLRAETMRGDLSLRRDQRDLADLERRKARVDAALAELKAAEEILSVNRVDEAALESIEALHLAVELGRSRAEARRPLVRVEALTALNGAIDGTRFELAANEQLERRVEETLSLTVPEVLTLTVVGGVDGDPNASQLEAKEQRLAQLCRQAGAADAADARRLHKIFRQAEQVRAAQRTLLKDNLAELTPEALESGLVALGATVAGYLEARGPEPGIAPDEAAARVAAAEADSVLATAERDRRVAELEADAAQTLLAELQTASRERAVELRLASEKVEELERALVADRAGASDEQLAARLRDTQAAEQSLGDQLRVVREQLDREGPDQVRATLENAQTTLANVDSELRAIQDGLLEVQTRLRDHGEDGLAEQLDEAVASLASAERDRAQYQSRAAARKLLFETLRTERETARRAYAGPLRQRIDQLGSFVFGSGFGVELDDSLRIVTRTIDGATIPFESLSVGAQEQLGLIARLACAMIVSPDEGVPLILDDALGNSDPQRLEAMGAVLAVAGRHCQIIVLTCQPDRYQHVGGATLVRLA